MSHNAKLYVSAIHILDKTLDVKRYARDILDYYHNGIPADQAAKELRSYTEYTVRIGKANHVEVPRKVGMPKSPHEAAAWLIRDFGKTEGLKRALTNTWSYPKGSPSFMFWGQVAYLLGE